MRFFTLVIIGLLAACAGPKLPAPNSADVRYDGRDRALQVMVSSLSLRLPWHSSPMTGHTTPQQASRS